MKKDIKRKIIKIVLILTLVPVFLTLIALIFCGVLKLKFCSDIRIVLEFWDYFLAGYIITMWLYLWALVIGFFLGLMLSIMRHYGGSYVKSKVGRIFLRFLKGIATGYIELVRGTPLLAQLLLLWYLPFGLNTGTWSFETSFRILDKKITLILLNPRTLIAIIALGLNSAAYQAEYLRGSILSVGNDQLIAAQSLGMSRGEGIRRIILPQALRRVIPSWSNEATYLPKYTVVVYFIAVVEIFAQAFTISNIVFRAFIVYIIVALIFLATIGLISKALDILHKRTAIPGL